MLRVRREILCLDGFLRWWRRSRRGDPSRLEGGSLLGFAFVEDLY